MALPGFLQGSNKLLIILVAAVGIFLFLTVFLIIRSFGTGQAEDITLEFWGVFDDRNAFDKAIRDYQAVNKGVRINYRMFTFEDYERSVVDALAAGTGPDIWMIHHTWLAKHRDKLTPMPEKISGLKEPLFTAKSYQDQFVDVAFNDLVKDGKIYGVPLYVDTLALYWNKDLFNTAGLTRPPTTWEEFIKYVDSEQNSLTKLDEQGNVIQAGAAMGSVQNVNRSTDILMALMLQSGVRMTNAQNTSSTLSQSVENLAVGEQALQFYTDFTNTLSKVYTWNDRMPYSIDAFVEGKAAMMLNYSHQVDAIRDRTPRLNFAVATVPQISLDSVRTYGSYWAPAVSLKATPAVAAQAWKFLAYLSSTEGARSYLTATKRPAARRDLIDLQKTDPDLGVFATQALSARSWYQVDAVGIATVFADMITSVNLGQSSVREALRNAETRITVLMSRR